MHIHSGSSGCASFEVYCCNGVYLESQVETAKEQHTSSNLSHTHTLTHTHKHSGHRDARWLQCTMISYGVVIGLPLWSQTVAPLRQPVFFSFVLKQRQHEPRVHPRIRVPHTELIFYICLEVEDYAVSVLAPDTPSPSLYAAREGPEGIMVFSVSGHNR